MYVDAMKMFIQAKIADPTVTGSMRMFIPVREAERFQVWLEQTYNAVHKNYKNGKTTFRYMELSVTWHTDDLDTWKVDIF